uniref:UDENN domain-containing protein n=1 Tax=Heterorhabditis bacteriophora TaxID=37862 RepID=A0A1I7WXY5_HETBA
MVTLFDVFCEVGAGQPNAHPLILTKYPEDYNDDAVLKISFTRQLMLYSIRQNSSDAVQLFCFVLTDSQSKYTFGYCRYTPRSNSCICLLSGFSWPNVFYKMLNHISLVMNNGTVSNCMEIIFFNKNIYLPLVLKIIIKIISLRKIYLIYISIQISSESRGFTASCSERKNIFFIGVKLGKLTPREIRKSKNWSLKKTKNNGFEPMSFDNVQWQDSQVSYVSRNIRYNGFISTSLQERNAFIPTEFTNHTSSDPFFDPFKTPITPSPDFCVVKRPPNDKDTWETFD